MSDADVDERLLRVSIGVEDWEDLKEDFLNAFKEVGRAAEKGAAGEEVDAQTGGKGARVESGAGGAV
jgi:hypothetical protein